MNIIAIDISEPNENGARMAIVRIDGRELLDIIRDAEQPLAAKADEPDLAGKYDYHNIKDVLYPSRHLLGDPIRPLLEYDGKISILECECGCEGCWPLIADVNVAEHQIEWCNFQQVHRDNWNFPDDFRFTFDRTQMEDALKIEA